MQKQKRRIKAHPDHHHKQLRDYEAAMAYWHLKNGFGKVHLDEYIVKNALMDSICWSYKSEDLHFL